MRKVRKDALWARLSEAQRDELMLRLQAGLGTAEASALVQSWLGGRAPSETSLSNLFHRHRLAWALPRARAAADEAAAALPGHLDDQTRRVLAQRRFTAVLEADTADLVALDRNEIARRKLELVEQRLALDERRFARLVLEKLDDLAALRDEGRRNGVDDEALVGRLVDALRGGAAA